MPEGEGVTPDGTRGYVSNANSNTVSVIDTAANKVVATILVGSFPRGLAVTPDGTHAYVVNAGANTVSVIGIAITPDGKHAYVTNDSFFGPGTVSVIDTATNTVAATVGVGSFPVGVGIIPDIPFSAFSLQRQARDRSPWRTKREFF
jgi:YVTN family beta-propeller protein